MSKNQKVYKIDHTSVLDFRWNFAKILLYKVYCK